MNIQILIRVILGVGFAYLGFFVSERVLTIEEAQILFTVRIVIAIASGATGVFIVPIVSEWVRTWSTIFANRIASEVIKQARIPDFSGMRELPGRISRRGEKEKGAADYVNPILVDTSALIDGRIADVVENGFLYGTLIVPKFILSELQHIADASNALRRGKGRRGLDILEKLKKSKQIETIIYEAGEVKGKTIDDKLLTLAKTLSAKVMTTDFNLNKVATVSGIKILNINDLVNSLKTTLLPGEPLEVKVIQDGKERTQGVGYLSDGTMIVVENGAKYKNQTIPTKVLRVLQTAAGRMIFVQANEITQNKEA